MAGHDDEQHAERHDHDIAVLQHQIGEVERLQQRAIGHELEEQHDREQREQHAVIAEVVPDKAAALVLFLALLGQRNRLVGHDCISPTRPSLPWSLRCTPDLSRSLRMIARMIFSWVASEPANSPTKAPSFMTQIRSQMPISSPISEEITTTPFPASASSLMIEYISYLAPTSMPRVGSSRIKTFGPVISHFDSTTFCWLPPESVPASW